jgi:hypothetical protein
MTTQDARETLPGYALSKIFKTRDNMYGTLKMRYVGIVLQESALESVLLDIQAHLPKTVPTPVLFETLRQYVGTKMEPQFLLDLAWRLSGTVKRLQQGIPAVPWKNPGIEEWAPMQILRVDPAPPRKTEHQYNLKMRILAGSACPLVIEKVFLRRALSTIGGVMGFTNSSGGRLMQRPEELVNLRFYGRLNPELARNGKPGFFDIRCPASCLEHNLELLKIRFRQGDATCPRSYRHECHACPVGYVSCPAGVHRDDLVQIVCQTCGDTGWCDPEINRTMCLKCQHKDMTQRKGL